MPRIIKRTLDICKRNSELNTQSEADTQVPPAMPKNLPPLIRLLVSRTPEIYQPAVAHAVFPALGAHLYNSITM